MDVALAANINVKVVSNLATLCLNNRPLQLVQVTSRGVGGVGVFFYFFICIYTPLWTFCLIFFLYCSEEK